jgi:hypothetical protein
MIPRKVGLIVIACACISPWPFVAKAAESEVCEKIQRQTADTVIAFEPPASFTICRDGKFETDVVTGRPIYVEVLADEHTSFRYSIHGLSNRPQRTGLTRLARRSHALAQSLRLLAESGETVGETSEQLHNAIVAIEHESLDLGGAMATLATWCDEVTKSPILPSALDHAVQGRCSSLHAVEASNSAEALVRTISTFRTARDQARALLIDARAKHSDNHGAEGAMHEAAPAFDKARELAVSLQRQARDLAPVAERIADTSGLLHEAMRGSGALRTGTPFRLGELEHDGFAVLQIDATPVVLSRSAEDWEDTDQEGVSQRFRFRVVSRHYVDVEAGVGVVAGIPGVPAFTTRGSSTVLTSKSISQFVGLALVELEPVRFFAPDHPLSGLLRFPVIGVPLNRDPTQNYFAGAGLGWTGIGSITAGPYITREASFAQGYGEGQTLPSGVAFATVTSPAYEVGYFVSASIDLLGLLHLFLPVRKPTFDVITGGDAATAR